MNKKGFTLVELLTAVIIMGVLVAMATPMYEKAMEKSRLSEVRMRMAKLLDAKLRVMSERNMSVYDTSLKVEQLDVAFPCDGGDCTGDTFSTKDFKYTLNPSSSASAPTGVTWLQNSGIEGKVQNGICAVRRTGPNAGTVFLFLGELSTEPSKRFFCHNGNTQDGCDNFGLVAQGGSAWCSL